MGFLYEHVCNRVTVSISLSHWYSGAWCDLFLIEALSSKGSVLSLIKLGNQHEPLPESLGILALTALTLNSYSGTRQRNLPWRSYWHQKSMLESNFRMQLHKQGSESLFKQRPFLYGESWTPSSKPPIFLMQTGDNSHWKNFPAVTNQGDRTCIQMNNRHLVSWAATLRQTLSSSVLAL